MDRATLDLPPSVLVGVAVSGADQRPDEPYRPVSALVCDMEVSPPRYLRGDANADGLLDAADAIFTLGYLFAEDPAPSCLDAADANDDGEIDIADPIAVVIHLFAGAGDLPEPFGACGPDPTADGLGCGGHPPCEE